MCVVSGPTTTERTFSKKRKSKWKRHEISGWQVPYSVSRNRKSCAAAFTAVSITVTYLAC
uniref:Uncharacterized protein n=1 Tax=Arundo donax TaxID=35708 RepID=A0A0A9GBR4_ARUDO